MYSNYMAHCVQALNRGDSRRWVRMGRILGLFFLWFVGDLMSWKLKQVEKCVCGVSGVSGGEFS